MPSNNTIDNPSTDSLNGHSPQSHINPPWATDVDDTYTDTTQDNTTSQNTSPTSPLHEFHLQPTMPPVPQPDNTRANNVLPHSVTSTTPNQADDALLSFKTKWSETFTRDSDWSQFTKDCDEFTEEVWNYCKNNGNLTNNIPKARDTSRPSNRPINVNRQPTAVQPSRSTKNTNRL